MHAPRLAWIDEVDPIDPLLREPLDLKAPKARRRIQAQAVMRALGFGHRLEPEIGDPVVMADTTYRLFFWMADGLATARSERIGSIQEEAMRIAHDHQPTGWVQGVEAIQALLDLGLSRTGINQASTLPNVLEHYAMSFRNQMTERLVKLLKDWKAKGWVQV